MWKFKWNMNRDKWLVVLAVGSLLLMIAVPSKKIVVPSSEKTKQTGDTIEASVRTENGYEEELENRVKEILKNVEGVGTVDVMIVLKSSEEKILRVDKNTSISSTEEQDSGGGNRSVRSEDSEEKTILLGSGENSSPVVEKEMKPEIAGIIISAGGGGSATVKAEISGAMEALFDVPPHKIKVLKRVE